MCLPYKNKSIASRTMQHAIKTCNALVFSFPRKIKKQKISFPSKNKTSQQHYPRQTMTNTHDKHATQYLWALQGGTNDNSTGGNTGFAKAGVQCFFDSEVGNQSFVHLINFCAEMPRLRKARNRWRSL